MWTCEGSVSTILVQISTFERIIFKWIELTRSNQQKQRTHERKRDREMGEMKSNLYPIVIDHWSSSMSASSRQFTIFNMNWSTHCLSNQVTSYFSFTCNACIWFVLHKFNVSTHSAYSWNSVPVESKLIIYLLCFSFDFCFCLLKCTRTKLHTLTSTFAACLILHRNSRHVCWSISVVCLLVLANWAKQTTKSTHSHTKFTCNFQRKLGVFCTHIQNDFVSIVCLQFRYIRGRTKKLNKNLFRSFSFHLLGDHKWWCELI